LKKFTNLFIAIGCGLLLYAAWPVSSFTFLVFIAFVPLLWLEKKVQSRKKFFGLVYITMLTWNIATTWWIWNASAPGALSAFFANSFIMCLPWLGYKVAKKWKGETVGYISLVAFWMCFEYIHLQDWGLSWPWLTLGNAFATQTGWVQWYEYTGTSGGTLWVLLSNILVFALFSEYQRNGRTIKYFKQMVSWVLLLILPILLSSFFKKSVSSDGRLSYNVVVVQPNIDPYEKVSTGSFEGQLQKLIVTTEKEMDDLTALVVWPETALYQTNGIFEESLKDNFFMNPLWSFLKRHPNISLFTGIESIRKFDRKTKYAHEYNGQFYESYNGSMLVDSSGPSAFYHKTMLVPGVETLPWFLKFLGKWFDKFGGTTGGYAKQDERPVIEEKHGYKIAPAICYESIYGEFMSKYVRNGANLICVITNDGWWKKTPGHKQHMSYARLRSIETRTWVARSANTGISCFIDPSGKLIYPQPYNTNAAIKFTIPVSNNYKTFFVQNGDLLSKIMVAMSAALLLWVTYLKVMDKWFRKENSLPK
jgi:apolipoprotein N-acyltransferase